MTEAGSWKSSKAIAVGLLIARVSSICLLTIAVLDAGVWSAFRLMKRLSPGAGDNRFQLPNYADQPWAATHFKELARLHGDYESFVGWRRADFAGETINTKGGIRRSDGEAVDASIWFLGGSAMWGTGVNDRTTIPSLAHHALQRAVLNLGEGAYTSRQSLETLLNMLSNGRRPALVVSYEGANDVNVQCLSDVDRLPVHYNEKDIAIQLARSSARTAIDFAKQFVSYVPDRLRTVWFTGVRTLAMDCRSGAHKTTLVAGQIVRSWEFMAAVLSRYNAPLLTVLQPTLPTARSRTNHLPQTSSVLADAYRAVYNEVRSVERNDCTVEKCGNFLDLSEYDFGDRYVFIDDVHLSPNGNALIARELARNLRGR